MAAKAGGPDPSMNPALRLVVDKAKAANMPNDNVERAIKKATSAVDETNYDEITYEGYGPGGVGILVHALTDNRNRTATNVRVALLETVDHWEKRVQSVTCLTAKDISLLNAMG